VEVCFLGMGLGKLELLEPLGPDSPVARFLARRGPGLHHIAYRVTDIEAMLAAWRPPGIELIDRVPRPGPTAIRSPSSTRAARAESSSSWSSPDGTPGARIGSEA
jgi:methylmalonyl-CoA epimerase